MAKEKIIGIDLGTTNSCFSIMEGSDSVVIANAEGASFASGTASTGISTGALAVSTIAETATDNLRIVGVKDDANPDYTAAGVILLVRLNLPAIEDATGINS